MIARSPTDIIETRPMRPAQVAVVALCVALNALDGFDVLSVSFAAPGISADWGIDRAALGVVLSLELFGMTLGSVLLGALCDRIGRRPVAIGCLAVMTLGMALAATAGDVVSLGIYRVLTGIGIGGMLSTTNAVVAEVASARRRYLSVTLMAGGYPLGAVLGGLLAGRLLVDHGWHAVFLIGAATSALLLPIVLLGMPETVAFLATRNRPDDPERIRRVLDRLGHRDQAFAEMAPPLSKARSAIADLFAPASRWIVVLMTIAFFMHMATFYFILKWAPKIVGDMGFAASAAGGVLVWANVGGLVGALSFSLCSQRFDVRPLAAFTTLASFVTVCLFGRSAPRLDELSALAALACFFTNGTVVCLYALLATRLPTRVRATGTGFAIGIGRGGAAASPVIVGQLLEAGTGLGATSALIGLGSVAACLCLLALPRRAAAG